MCAWNSRQREEIAKELDETFWKMLINSVVMIDTYVESHSLVYFILKYKSLRSVVCE